MPTWLMAMLVAPAESVAEPTAGKSERSVRKRTKSEKAAGSRQGRSAKTADRSDARASKRASAGRQAAFTVASAAVAETSTLSADMIERFPVPGVGHRHGVMTRAVGSLVGRGTADVTIKEVLLAWWERYHGLGLIASDRDEMERDLVACITSTRMNPDFRAASSQADYEDTAAGFHLPQDVLDLLNAPLAHLKADGDGDGLGGPEDRAGESTTVASQGRDQSFCYQGACYLGEDAPTHHTNTLYRGNTNELSLVRVTREVDPDVTRGIERVSDPGNTNKQSPSGTAGAPGNTKKRSLMGSLCETQDERRFVEALMVMLARQRQAATGAPSRFRVTHDQLRRVAATRYGLELPVWENSQIARLKEKYIGRLRTDGQHDSASRFELFREVVKGQRARGKDKGTPSIFEPTGIEAFFRVRPSPSEPPVP